MSKYGKVACLAASKAQKGTAPQAAWKESAHSVFPNQPASRDKGCPRCAFLGLAGEGFISKISPGSYTNSQDNRHYALLGVDLLRQEPSLCDNSGELWGRVMRVLGMEKKHNNQMDVVTALWKSGHIRHCA